MVKLTRREAAELGLVALPFLAVIALFHGLRDAFPTFHGTDELSYHLPTIETFARQLPAPDLRTYNSATGPLFHLLFAAIARAIGFALAPLRLVNVAISLAAAYGFFRIVTRAGVESFHQRVLLTALFACSPYVFGASFLLLTDNLGILLAVFALEQLLRTEESKRLGPWIAFCALACGAILTRQLYVWLPLAGALAMMMRPATRQRRIAIAGLLAASVLPLALLVHAWGGLVPPRFQAEHVASGFNPRAVMFALAVTGLYGVALDPSRALRSLITRSTARTIALGAAAVALLLLFAVTMQPHTGDDGILWRVSHALPVFWLLAPAGAYVIAFDAASDRRLDCLAAWMTLAFIAVNAANQTVYEKYFDPMIIVLVSLSLERKANRLAVVMRAALLVAFLVYPLASWTLTQRG